MNFSILTPFLLAAIGSWLGLSLLLRDARDRATRAFAWLSLNLALYGLTTALAPLSASPQVIQALLTVQVIETLLLPPIFMHFILTLIDSNLRPRWQNYLLYCCYILGAAMALYALFGSGMQQERDIMRFPPGVLSWLWVVQRAVPISVALALMVQHYLQAGGDDLARRRRLLFAVSAALGVFGTLIATALSELRLSPAIGHLLMTLSLMVLAYSVLVYRSLLPDRIARRPLYRSMVGGALTVGYVALIIAAEPRISAALQLRGGLVSAFLLLVLLAIAAPLRDWISSQIDRLFFHREFDFGQLLRTIGDDVFDRGELPDQLHTALSAICGSLDLQHGAVAVLEGRGLRLMAHYGTLQPDAELLHKVELPAAEMMTFGDWQAWPEVRLLLPLVNAEEPLGLLMLGQKRSGEPYRDTERALLSSLGAYLALSIRHARHQMEERLALAVLAEQSRQLQAEQQLLLSQASIARQPEPSQSHSQQQGLWVYALGTLRVERDGEVIERWGGDKAGTYQAEALFAFLFDRRGRGISKDEVAEVIWPELAIDKADTAFHRTLSALRRTLEPGLKRGNQSITVTFHHDRYWLNPAAIAGSDVEQFSAAIERAHSAARSEDIPKAIASFNQALMLYRGIYLDDCPFYGDSSYVEPHRIELHAQHLEALLTLGHIHERLGQSSDAAACFRRALLATEGDCPAAEEGIARLQMRF